MLNATQYNNVLAATVNAYADCNLSKMQRNLHYNATQSCSVAQYKSIMLAALNNSNYNAFNATNVCNAITRFCNKHKIALNTVSIYAAREGSVCFYINFACLTHAYLFSKYCSYKNCALHVCTCTNSNKIATNFTQLRVWFT